MPLLLKFELLSLYGVTILSSVMALFSLLQIDVEMEEPETSENPTQSFEIHNIFWRLTQVLAVIIYII